jgi:hypothetical protein
LKSFSFLFFWNLLKEIQKTSCSHYLHNPHNPYYIKSIKVIVILSFIGSRLFQAQKVVVTQLCKVLCFQSRLDWTVLLITTHIAFLGHETSFTATSIFTAFKNRNLSNYKISYSSSEAWVRAASFVIGRYLAFAGVFFFFLTLLFITFVKSFMSSFWVAYITANWKWINWSHSLVMERTNISNW